METLRHVYDAGTVADELEKTGGVLASQPEKPSSTGPSEAGKPALKK
jgi:hypothetical protein